MTRLQLGKRRQQIAKGLPALQNRVATFEALEDRRVLSINLLHSFAGTSDGEDPSAGLTLVGSTFYGTTATGGSISGGGTVFSINTDGWDSLCCTPSPAGLVTAMFQRRA